MSSDRFSVDGRALTRGEANLLLIELKRLPAGAVSPAGSAAAVVKRAVSEKAELPLTADQAAAVKRALEGIRLKRHGLPPALANLRSRLHA